MKVYVFVSAAHFNDECADIQDVKVFLKEHEAIEFLHKNVIELTSDEGGWNVFSKRPRHYQLTDGDDEYVAYVAEREL